MIFEDMTFVFTIHPAQIKGNSPAYEFINLLCNRPRRNYIKQISHGLIAIERTCSSGTGDPRPPPPECLRVLRHRAQCWRTMFLPLAVR